MPIPSQTITINDPGLGIVDFAPTAPLVLGTSQTGTAAVLKSFSRKADVVAEFGQGPLPEVACRVLDFSGGPIHCMRLTGSVAGTNSAVTAAPIGAATGTITLGGAPYDDYEATVEILKTGTLGAGTFRYSLDNRNSYSGEVVIPSGGAFTIPSTNIVATFVAGAGPTFFEKGDLHTWTSTAPYYSTANVATAVTALLAQTVEFPFIILTGQPTSAANGATMFSALDGHATSFANANRYLRWLMDFGVDTVANAQAQLAGVTSTRVSACYGTAHMASSKPFVGYGFPKKSIVDVVGPWAAKQLMSTDLARVLSGPLTGVIDVSNDENLSAQLDAFKATTTRTHTGRGGLFLTNAWLKSGPGSDFRYWQHGRVMDVACRRVFIEQQNFLSKGHRTKSDGTLDERDATNLEQIVRAALAVELTQPKNAEGGHGHVSALSYVVDREQNIVTTEQLVTTVSIRPLGYSKTISTTIGFSLNVGG